MELQPEFGYVLVVYLLLFVVYQWMSAKVMTARKKYKVPYPSAPLPTLRCPVLASTSHPQLCTLLIPTPTPKHSTAVGLWALSYSRAPYIPSLHTVQRGHQNSLEQLPWLLSFLFVAGVHFPITAAVGGLICVLGRISYFLGYSSGDPDKRMQGMYGYLGLLTLLGCVITAAVSLLRA